MKKKLIFEKIWKIVRTSKNHDEILSFLLIIVIESYL